MLVHWALFSQGFGLTVKRSTQPGPWREVLLENVSRKTCARPHQPVSMFQRFIIQQVALSPVSVSFKKKKKVPLSRLELLTLSLRAPRAQLVTQKNTKAFLSRNSRTGSALDKDPLPPLKRAARCTQITPHTHTHTPWHLQFFQRLPDLDQITQWQTDRQTDRQTDNGIVTNAGVCRSITHHHQCLSNYLMQKNIPRCKYLLVGIKADISGLVCRDVRGKQCTFQKGWNHLNMLCCLIYNSSAFREGWMLFMIQGRPLTSGPGTTHCDILFVCFPLGVKSNMHEPQDCRAPMAALAARKALTAGKKSETSTEVEPYCSPSPVLYSHKPCHCHLMYCVSS